MQLIPERVMRQFGNKNAIFDGMTVCGLIFFFQIIFQLNSFMPYVISLYYQLEQSISVLRDVVGIFLFY